MIIIYNITGLLVGLVGVAAGFMASFALIAIGSPVWLAPGVLTIAGIWGAFGRAKPNFETGEMRPAPSIFFIPLFYWGILIGFLSLPLAAIEVLARQAQNPNVRNQIAQDPRRQQFQDLVDGLDRNKTDDDVLSEMVTTMVAQAFPGQPVNVAIKSSDSNVLVLMKLKNLKKVKDPDRVFLLNNIRELATKRRPGVHVYAGIKGEIFFGAISTPGRTEDVGKIVEEDPLLVFFDEVTKAEDASKSDVPVAKPVEADAESSPPAVEESLTRPKPSNDNLPKNPDAE